MAEKIAGENGIVLWFQGRMEYGPRALGNRSVLAMPNVAENRNRINLMIKDRPYYQPFASTILEDEAPRLLEQCSRTAGSKACPYHQRYPVPVFLRR